MKILIATDGSKYSEKATMRFCEFIKTGKDMELKIISAVESIKPMAAEPFGVSAEFYLKVDQEASKNAEGFVQDAKKIIEEKLGDSTPEIETAVIMTSPKTAIIEEAKDWGSDLIVVGSHGYGFWDRMLIGSVSDAVIHHAPCSVLIVKNGEK
jgi:nucleotide-binding universal stress UspA family protein